MLRSASAMIAEREALRMGIEHLTVLFPTEVSSFDFHIESTDRTVQYKLNAQSLRLFGLHSDVNDAFALVRIVSKTKNKQTAVWAQACGSERKTGFVIIVYLWFIRCPRSFLDPCWCVGGSSITILPPLVQTIRTFATLTNLCSVCACQHVTVSRYCRFCARFCDGRSTQGDSAATASSEAGFYEEELRLTWK